MGNIVINQGLEITVPTSGTRNWATNLLNLAWKKISAHNHTGGGNGNQITAPAIADRNVTSIKLDENIAFTQANPVSVTVPANTAALDFNTGNIQRLSLAAATGDVTVTLSNPQAGAVYKIWITQHGTAVKDILWPGDVFWPQGTKYGSLVSQGVSDLDCVTLYYDGTNYLGDWQLDWKATP